MDQAEGVVEASLESRIEALADRLVPDDKPKQEAPVQQTEEAAPEVTIEAAPEHYEFEFDGAKYQVPPELKKLHEGYMRQSDYTKKTTEAADMRRTAEARAQEVKHQDELREALRPEYEKQAIINLQLKHLQSRDMTKLLDENPVEAQKLIWQVQQIKEAKSQNEEAIKSASERYNKGINEARAKLVEEGSKILERDLKGWSSERALALNAFVKSQYGFTEPEVSEITDPRWVKMAHDASEWQKLQASKPQVATKVAASTLKPQASQGDGQQTANDLRQKIRSAKTDQSKERYIAELLESKLR